MNLYPNHILNVTSIPLNHLTAEPFTIFSRNSAYVSIAYSRLEVKYDAIVREQFLNPYVLGQRQDMAD